MSTVFAVFAEENFYPLVFNSIHCCKMVQLSAATLDQGLRFASTGSPGLSPEKENAPALV